MTVAIISEYNPFHSGHEYQLRAIREAFGADTKIIAIMSGNFTQRGEIAIADKYKRSEWAVRCGVNLVLELPFPYSMSSAEIFARSAVSIIKSIAVVDAISFGSESGELSSLEKISENMLKPEYKEAFFQLSKSPEGKNLGYPVLCQTAYEHTFSEDLSEIFLPNNILAIEYLKAIKELNAPLKAHTVKRLGASYDEENITDKEHESALSIRRALLSGNSNFIKSIPEAMRDSFCESLSNKEFPTDEDKLSSAVISHFRLNTLCSGEDVFDARGGLYCRLKNESREATDIKSLVSSSETKKFTNARIKRAIFYSFFGVTSSDVKELPKFSQVLAFDKEGQALLKSIKAKSDFPLITKPSATDALDGVGKMQKQLLDKADSIFQLTKPGAVSGNDALRRTPFVKNSK